MCEVRNLWGSRLQVLGLFVCVGMARDGRGSYREDKGNERSVAAEVMVVVVVF